METETRFLWKQRTSEKSFSQPQQALPLHASTKDYRRIRNILPFLWSPIIILGMGDNNGDIKKSARGYILTWIRSLTWNLQHYPQWVEWGSSPLLCARGKKLISLLTSTTILRRFQSLWYVKVCVTHCRFEYDRLLKTFGWNLQQLGNHPDFLCAYYSCNILTISLYPH